MIVRILQEMLRSSEGSFDWNVIAEPKVKDTFDDFLGAWDEPETEEQTVIVKHARVKVDDAKGKGPVDADPTQNDLPLPPQSSRGLKRKQDEDDADEENEHQGEDKYKDEEEYENDEKRDEKRDESKKKAARPKRKRVKSTAEVHSEDDAERMSHPDRTCDGCSHAGILCELSSVSRTACDRCHGLKVKCSNSKNKEGKKGESSRKLEPRKVLPKRSVTTRKPSPMRPKPTSATHLLGETMTVFRNPHAQGTSTIPIKSIGHVIVQEEEGETVIRVMRPQGDAEPRTSRERSGSVPQGSIWPGHDQEIPSKSFIGLQYRF